METEGKDNDANDPDYLIDLIARLSPSLSLSLSVSPLSLSTSRSKRMILSLSLSTYLSGQKFLLSRIVFESFSLFLRCFFSLHLTYLLLQSTLWEMTLNANGKHWGAFLEKLRFKWQTLVSQCLYNVCIIK